MRAAKWEVAALLGGVVYLYFRVDVRPELEQAGHWQALGLFDIKEHFVAIGLALLLAYWVFWQQAGSDEPTRRTRQAGDGHPGADRRVCGANKRP